MTNDGGAAPAGAARPRSWAEIDLGAFGRNLAACRRLAPGGRVLAVLKADAYGHGAKTLGPVAEAGGAAMIGVGDSTEALELREAGIRGDILVLGALVPAEIPRVVAAGITPVIHSGGRLAEVEEEARRQGRRVPIHLKVDTGMGRLGMLPARVVELARRTAASPHLELAGLMSHLAGTGEEGRAVNCAQADAFFGVVEALARVGLRPPEIHVRNSTGLLDPALAGRGETMARAGAILYGFLSAGTEPLPGFEPVLALRTQLCFLKDVPAGFPVGYGGTFKTARPTRLGVIPLGYHDGMKRSLGGRGEALLRGRRVPIVGIVSMDYATLDITDAQNAAVGDVVTLIGEDGGERLTASEVASRAGTVPHDVVAGLGRRVVRVAQGAVAP